MVTVEIIDITVIIIVVKIRIDSNEMFKKISKINKMYK